MRRTRLKVVKLRCGLHGRVNRSFRVCDFLRKGLRARSGGLRRGKSSLTSEFASLLGTSASHEGSRVEGVGRNWRSWVELIFYCMMDREWGVWKGGESRFVEGRLMLVQRSGKLYRIATESRSQHLMHNDLSCALHVYSFTSTVILGWPQIGRPLVWSLRTTPTVVRVQAECVASK